ncbi:DJ-1/PfpI family protein [Lactobacillus sp. ESL0681]|uniref:DJ-1/PfpI family protein n=1 Tax=Lactobacillus sp. ESL0681 TaxID=2983211 RepID=UPI0023F7DD71|nr:DJ-1/PfpI family protein [Lactobacillus sp. ESL0681]WEV41077.1 DJ-1/PfpI family protein [Lactobacillus sp. ESL0681]
MTKIAVVFANGCEEVEGLSQVDVFRRLGITTDMVGLTSTEIIGDHQIKLICNQVIGSDLLDYEVVVFPGGKQGAENLRASQELGDIMISRQAANKWNAAMCAAPIAFAHYGLLNNADYTCYPGFDKQTKKEAPSGHFKTTITVTDYQNRIITSRGPATAWAFAYAIAEAVGVSTKELKEGMLYNYLANNIKDSL